MVRISAHDLYTFMNMSFLTKMTLALISMMAIGISGPSQSPVEWSVVSVIDGNTIMLATGQDTVNILLYGIDCPEPGQPYSEEARTHLEQLVLNENVKVEMKGKDRWGNRLGIVAFGDNDLRISLLQEGLAWTAERNPEEDLEAIRQRAMSEARGLWGQEEPVAPWIYRRKQSMMEIKSN